MRAALKEHPIEKQVYTNKPGVACGMKGSFIQAALLVAAQEVASLKYAVRSGI